MKLFFDVIFALLPLGLIALPITALLILHGVLRANEKKAKTDQGQDTGA